MATIRSSNTVVEGIVRARQDALSENAEQKVFPVLIHGDAIVTPENWTVC
jgi:2-oxoglutarate dehydrogenase complex dehydrogenase (E1) component-like enzyme